MQVNKENIDCCNSIMELIKGKTTGDAIAILEYVKTMTMTASHVDGTGFPVSVSLEDL